MPRDRKRPQRDSDQPQTCTKTTTMQSETLFSCLLLCSRAGGVCRFAHLPPGVRCYRTHALKTWLMLLIFLCICLLVTDSVSEDAETSRVCDSMLTNTETQQQGLFLPLCVCVCVCVHVLKWWFPTFSWLATFLKWSTVDFWPSVAGWCRQRWWAVHLFLEKT